MAGPDRLLVGVSGLGSIGRQHVRAFASIGCDRIVAFDPDPGFRHDATGERGVIATVGDFGDLLEAKPDVLVVAAPDAVHVDQLDAATRAGIPTLVEKPIAASLSEADRLVRIERRGVPVLVGYVLRHRRIMRTVRNELAAGSIGTPTSFQIMLGSYGTVLAARSRFREPEPNRLYRDYSHEWDYIRWFFGDIQQVCAVARVTDDVPHVEQPNLVDGLVRCASGLVGAFHLDYAEPVGTRTLHVIGTRGTLFVDVARGCGTIRTPDHEAGRDIGAPEAPSEALARQAAHLLDVARGDCAPAAGIADGLAALAVADAAIGAAERGGWVPVGGGTS